MDFKLNRQQLAAVNDVEGAVLVIAGAGSGKTRVLTAHICHLIETGASPSEILAITFTNKAANEMKERIERAIGSSNVWTSTFHSLCARILRMEAQAIGYSRDFTIYTEQESDRVVRRVVQNCPAADPKRKNEYLWHISRAKNMEMSPDEYYAAIKDADRDAAAVTSVYRSYEEELKRSNSLDFDDLLLKTAWLFENNSEVLEKYRRRFKYINVDEFQDTNGLQYKIVKLLSNGCKNIFVVGDEDQSIYSWRGADINNILGFAKDFPGAKTYKLEQNYRSTTSILEAANNVIKNNSNRNDKTLWSDLRESNCVEYYEAYSGRDEAEKVARAIKVLTDRGDSYRDCAVLVRANSLTRQFEEEFNLCNIPYKVFGGFRFFERKEIKDALAYVRIALNPADNDSLLRVINFPRRGIGDSSVETLVASATVAGGSCFAALSDIDGLPSALAKKLKPFKEIVCDLIDNVGKMQPTEFVQYVLRRAGIENALKTSNDPEDLNRLENIEELVSAVQQFEKDNDGATISDFMQSVALVSDTDEMDGDNYVTIATVHAVKGLEFENVFIVGLEEGIFPTQRAIIGGDLEEERRLMYVAITRAKKRLFVLNAKSRYRFGKTEEYPQSRFVGEMTGFKKSVRYTNSDYSPYAKSYDDGRIKLGANAAAPTYKKSFLSQKSPLGATQKSAGKNIDYSSYVKNVVVEHNKFGKGVIVETVGEGEDKIAAIAFKNLGVKRFVLAIAAPSLKIVGSTDDFIDET